ncbi:hypothetical protein EJ05DRAFT_476205 [Pseudovirgaria hyperparasitica]|uniref:PHD-type domain-containing protein n=1 Tax=Pseudovirgaria hyperparasitica TaxID=470096 RepID=A0A6A6W4V9_9PEZI|nr:uncharacterized protein EJ05DRAFT_476205 [Pseudovirgaria hyperparasitica]KAF2757912.1 hypothetical protein EJ05DRAFT_476205 [Pseudovirgaria hyperparasitica]
MSSNPANLLNPTLKSEPSQQSSDTDGTRHNNAPDAEVNNTAYDAADALASNSQPGSDVAHTSSSSVQIAANNDSPFGRAAFHNPSPLHPTSAVDTLREPGYDRDEVLSAQTRLPSPLTNNPDISLQPEISGCLTPTKIKPEPSRDDTPTIADDETLRTVTDLHNEHGLRVGNKDTPTTIPDTKPAMASATSKKRPKSSKKGPGKRPSKKQKLDVDGAGTNNIPLSRSATPSRGFKGAAAKSNKTSQAGTPAGASPASYSNQLSSDVDASDTTEDDLIYCICRGKDDHTWMVGCEACDEWFHSRCVELRKEDHELLLYKFTCPACEAEGKGHTIWKPMCRREGCKRPAYENEKGERSKYCSEACGIEFFSNVVRAVSRLHAPNTATQKKRALAAKRKGNATDALDFDLDNSDDEYEAPPRGGVIRARDLKALVTSVPDISEFQRLGSGILSPPATPSGAMNDANGKGTSETTTTYPLTAHESTRVSELRRQQAKLTNESSRLKDREKFISMIRERANQWAEGEGIKTKTQICGWDTRLRWNEAEFELWRNNAYGRACLDGNTWDPSAEDLERARVAHAAAVKVDHHGDVDMTDDDGAKPADSLSQEYSEPMDESAWCHKKQCTLHRGWQKLHTHELRFEQGEIAQGRKILANEEKEIRERAMVRWRRDKVGEGLDRESSTTEKRNREGWAEVVG